jgi:hypothetical protein
MLRGLIALSGISLILRTLLAHNVVANWAVTLAAVYFAPLLLHGHVVNRS